MKIIKLKNQDSDLPSLTITGGKLKLHGTINNNDLITVTDKLSLNILLDYCKKELARSNNNII